MLAKLKEAIEGKLIEEFLKVHGIDKHQIILGAKYVRDDCLGDYFIVSLADNIMKEVSVDLMPKTLKDHLMILHSFAN